MRWIPFLILTYVVLLIQCTAGRVLVIHPEGLAPIGPDLAALVAVFMAFYARGWADAVLAAWVLGLALDLTAGGGVGATAVGPMALAYAGAAGLLFRVREAFFRERAMTQALLALAFCLLTHTAWVTVQSLLAHGEVTASAYGLMMLQAVALACYSAALMPLVHFVLARCQRWFLTAPVGSGRRRR
jgi:rod shape-determining protein MreD